MGKTENEWIYPMKRTRQREDVCRVLKNADKPLSAIDIYEQIRRENAEVGYAISTVYRALQIFEENHLVEKSTLSGSDMAYYTWEKEQHQHYAICLKCHKMIALKECPYEHMHFEAEDFTVTNHKIELYGYCKKCEEKVN